MKKLLPDGRVEFSNLDVCSWCRNLISKEQRFMLSALQEICFLTVTSGQLSRKSRSVMDLTVAKERQKREEYYKTKGRTHTLISKEAFLGIIVNFLFFQCHPIYISGHKCIFRRKSHTKMLFNCYFSWNNNYFSSNNKYYYYSWINNRVRLLVPYLERYLK